MSCSETLGATLHCASAYNPPARFTQILLRFETILAGANDVVSVQNGLDKLN
jgi:hypothetical protein